MADDFRVIHDKIVRPTAAERAVLDGRAASYLKCAHCGFLDKEDFIHERMHKIGYACRNCGGWDFRHDFPISKEESKRIVDGFYKTNDV